MGLDDILSQFHRRPQRSTPEDTISDFKKNSRITDEYVRRLTDRLLEKYADFIFRQVYDERDGSWSFDADASRKMYETAVRTQALRYSGMLEGAAMVDKADGWAAIIGTSLEVFLPVIGSVLDTAKDFLELSFKSKHILNHYVVQRKLNGEDIDWARIGTLATVEAFSFVPYIGQATDLAHIYKKMAEDYIITQAFNQCNPSLPRGFDAAYFAKQVIQEPFKLGR